MKPCRWREPLRKGKHVCRSNRLVGAAAGVTPQFCESVCPYVNHEPVASPQLRMNGPCLYLGEETGQTEDCPSCNGRVRLKLIGCSLHGPIVPSRECQQCVDYEPAAGLGVPDLVPGVADPLPRVPIAYHQGEWATLPRVRARHIDAFDRLAKTTMPDPPAAAGYGIVVVGGGRYWPMVALAVRMARDFTSLPIQIWHRGAGEPVNPADLADLPNLHYRDTTKYAARILGGWEAKAIALMHCGFERVFYIDADAYLVGNPEPLFDLVSRDCPLVYWHDYDPKVRSIRWDGFGLPEPANFPAIQGGHLFWHIPGAWRELILSHWLNQHSDYAYHHAYGDQDLWRVAFAKTGKPTHCLGPAPWVQPGFVIQHAGRPLIVHRVQDKIWSFAHPHKQHHFPEESRLHNHLSRLRNGPQTAGQVFAEVYRSGLWGTVAPSGTGSGEEEARPYIEIVSRLIATRGWRTVADLGCGDGYVASQIRGALVTGVDCVDVDAAGIAKRPAGVRFLGLDLDDDREQLPAADAALVKDVLHHWPTKKLLDWISWARASRKWKTLVLTNDRHQGDKEDCPLGGYRGLDPGLHPLASIKGLQPHAEFLHKAVLLLACD